MFKKNVVIIFLIVIILAAGFFYVRYTWSKNLQDVSDKVLTFAKVSEVSLNGEMLKFLTGTPEDVGTVPYESIKNRLINLVKVDQDLAFTYIYTQREGKIYFLADSEPVDSEDYSPPGQEYTEADSQMFQPFLTGEAMITKPVADRWGTWVSVLVPMKDFKTGEIKNVFGMDYPADHWQKSAIFSTIQAGVTTFFLVFLLIAFLIIGRSNLKIKENRRKMEEIQKEQEMILDSIPAWVFYKDDKNNFIRVNKAFADVLKKSKDQIEGKSVFDIFPKEQADAYLKDDLEVISSGVPKRNIIESMQSPEGVLWVQTDKIPNRNDSGKIIGIIGFTIDITARKSAEDQIKNRSEELERLNNLMIGRELEMINLKKELAELKSKN
jgi:PAS domain S-box-containing protein